MVGIMAGCFAIVTSTKSSYWILRFKESGLMAEYVFLYRYTIVALIFTYIMCLVAVAHHELLPLCFSLLVVNLGYVALVIYGGHYIADKAEHPPEE